MINHLRSHAIVPTALAMVAAMLSVGATKVGAADAGAATSWTRPARLALDVPSGSVALGEVASDQDLTFSVGLAPSHPSELEALLAAQRDPASPQFGHYLASGEFARQFGPSATEVDGVTSWLRRVGFGDVTVEGPVVRVRTTAARASAALGISMERYRTPDRADAFFARNAPLVPSAIAGTITTIVGLSSGTAALPRLDSTPSPASAASAPLAAPRADGLTPCTAAKNAAGSTFFTADQVGALYGIDNLFNHGQTGTGKRIAMVELAPHSAPNTTAYLTCFGLHNAVTTVAIDGGGTLDTNGSNGTLEANIDIEEAATQAPGAAIVSYEGPNTLQGELDVYSRIVTDDTAVAVSTSWGICEASSNPSFNSAIAGLLAQAAAQGQTVVAASGDNGSEDCFAQGQGSPNLAVDTPADDPNITGVGGTSLAAGGSETVWNDCVGQTTYAQCTTALGGNPGGSAGGGLSTDVDRPAWQPLVNGGVCTRAATGGTCRQVPDVSANAGTGEIFRSGNAWVAVGGTSIAAPKIAAIAADVDTACSAPVGDLAPKLVSIAAHGGLGVSLHDVTTGQNDLSRTNANLYGAQAGIDIATGTGTPIAGGWSCPQVTALSSTRGAAGAHLTITGFGLSTASFTFGNTIATVTARTATSATVVVPPGSGIVAVRGTNTMGSGTHTVNFGYPGSAPPSQAGPQPPAPPAVDRAYRTVASDGGIFDFGGAPFYGSTGAIRLNQPIVAMAADPATGGYWFVARDGGIFAFRAPFLGSAAGFGLTAAVVGMASTPNGKGYWLVTASGQVFAFGAAPSLGSAPNVRAPIVGIAPASDGRGYWLAGSDGSVYRFGTAGNFGSMAGTRLNRPVVGISADPATGGYWMVATDGGIFGFRAPFLGSTGEIHLNQPIVGIAPTRDGKGYRMVARDGGIFSFGTATFSGSMGGAHLNQPMVGIAD